MNLPERRSGLAGYFLVAAIGLAVAAFSGAPLAWDGSVYLFQLLDDQRPFVPHYRFVNVVLQAPVLALSMLTSDLVLLRIAFGLAYASAPLLVLAACWWVVRRHAPTLFIWATLGIGLGMLPGQFNFIGEAMLAAQLFWPLALALLIGIRREHVPVVVLLAALLVVTHPVAAPLFLAATGLSLVLGIRMPERRRTLWTWAALFALLTLGTGTRLWLFRTPYEIEQSSPEIVTWTFSVSVIGLPLLALAGGMTIAVLVFLRPRLADRQRLSRLLQGAEILAIVITTTLLIRWAIDPEQWRWALKYGYWAPVGSLTFLGFAALEVLHRPTPAGSVSGEEAVRERDGRAWADRIRTAQLVGLACSLVLIVQSAAWLQLSDRLNMSMAQSDWTCVPMSRLGWLDDTALNSFATPAYSVLLQGRSPSKVVLGGDACGTETFEDGVALHPFAMREVSTGWFDLQPLAQELRSEQASPRNGCTFGLTTGWHQTETNGPFWWRWSDGQDARLRVVVAEAGLLTLDGQIETAQTPNRVGILVNGEEQATLDVTWEGLQSFGPLALPVEAGVNTVALVSQNPPVEIERRPLGVGVANMTATYGEGSTTCALHP